MFTEEGRVDERCCMSSDRRFGNSHGGQVREGGRERVEERREERRGEERRGSEIGKLRQTRTQRDREREK